MINGCVAVRGRPSDFDRWVDAGAVGWGWEDVLPYYERAERELSIKTHPRELWMPVQELLVRGCEELGFRYVEDLNAPDAWDGVTGAWPQNRRNEVRQGSLVNYIEAARHRPNFRIWDRLEVDRVVLRDGRACGVNVRDDTGSEREIAGDLVVLAAGAYGTPPILLRSGIGPPAHLAAHDIDPIVDLPVGLGVMEHPGISFVLEVPEGDTRVGWPSNAAVARGPGWWCIPQPYDEEHGLMVLSFFLALTEGPDGTVALQSRDPRDPPAIDHGYAALVDSDAFVDAYAFFQQLLETTAFRAVDAVDPDAAVPLRDRVLQRLTTGYHPAGGCSIGKVVDPDLHVYGVERLVVADASAFPRHVSNNTNVTCHMLGEYAAAKLRGVFSR